MEISGPYVRERLVHTTHVSDFIQLTAARTSGRHSGGKASSRREILWSSKIEALPTAVYPLNRRHILQCAEMCAAEVA